MFLKLTCPNSTLVNEIFSCSLCAKSSNHSNIMVNVDFGDFQIKSFILNDSSIQINKSYTSAGLYVINAYFKDYPHNDDSLINGKKNSLYNTKIDKNYIFFINSKFSFNYNSNHKYDLN